MIKKIDHIGIVVRKLEDAVKIYRDKLHLNYIGEEENEAYNCRIGFLECDDVLIELIEPTGEGPSAMFLKEHGEGLHHICYEVDNIDQALKEARSNGMTDYEVPKEGAGASMVFFLNADKVCSVETEYVELKK